MNWTYNNAYEVEGIDARYIIVSYHRDNTRMEEKSKWAISEEDEIECFKQALLSEWYINNKAFGLRSSGTDMFQIVGHNPQQEELKLAKFTNDAAGARAWHGYPADYVRKIQDRPPTAILSKWYEAQVVSKDAMAKIRLGKVCSL